MTHPGQGGVPRAGPRRTRLLPLTVKCPRELRLSRGRASLDAAPAGISVELGAGRPGATAARRVIVMRDPDGNEFRVIDHPAP